MDSQATGVDGLVQLVKDPSLPVARKGYDREATDRLLGQLEVGIKETVRQHDEALSRVSELERRLTEGQEREEAVTEALVVATQIRADSEREGEELKAKYLSEAEAMEREVKQRADEVVKDAEAKADRILEDARLKARGFEQETRDAEQLAVEARARLTAFLESLLAKIESRGPVLGSAVDDELLSRASEAGRSDGERELELEVLPDRPATGEPKAGKPEPPAAGNA